MVKNVKTLCRMCDDHCGINVSLEGGKPIKIEGMKEHPWNEGRLCARGKAALEWVQSPERLLNPLKKVNGKWVEISLENALDEIAERINSIQKKYGDRSIGIWKGEAVGFNQQQDYPRRFAYAIGTPNYFSNNTQCSMARKIAFSVVRGSYPTADLRNSKCIIIWGVNPPNSQFQLGKMILDACKNGAKLVVIDPRLSAMARKADIYIPINPGTDGALALGIINLIIKNKWYDEEFVKNYTIGFKELADYAAGFTEKYVQEETGVTSDILFKVARIFTENAPHSTILTGNGLDHSKNAVNNIRAIASIAALCGCIDQPGGDLMPEVIELNSLRPEWKALQHKEPIGYKEYPVLYEYQENHTLLAMDALLNEKPYPIKGMIVTAANPILTNANAQKVKKAFLKLDLLVVKDLFLTETAKLAHYVLPAASFLERSELVINKLFQTITKTAKVFSYKNCQDEYQFWHDLAVRLGLEEYFPWKDEEEVNNWLLKPTGITAELLMKFPQGFVYKPIQHLKYKTMKKPFNTASGKVEFTSAYLKSLGYPELPEYSSPSYKINKDDRYPFVLISGARIAFYNHSRYHNIPRFKKVVPEPEVEINSQDALKLGICSGDLVKVSSKMGAIEIKAKVLAPSEIVSGVVQITHGWKEANVNLLTPDDENDPISGFPALKEVPVNIEKVKK